MNPKKSQQKPGQQQQGGGNDTQLQQTQGSPAPADDLRHGGGDAGFGPDPRPQRAPGKR